MRGCKSARREAEAIGGKANESGEEGAREDWRQTKGGVLQTRPGRGAAVPKRLERRGFPTCRQGSWSPGSCCPLVRCSGAARGEGQPVWGGGSEPRRVDRLPAAPDAVPVFRKAMRSRHQLRSPGNKARKTVVDRQRGSEGSPLVTVGGVSFGRPPRTRYGKPPAAPRP